MKTDSKLEKHIKEFHREIVEFAKKYQFRDRNAVICCSISVSQCYVLETLNTFGALSVQELAEKMYLKISTITRIVDHLVKKGYVDRIKNPNDMRFKIIRLTEQGRDKYREAWREFSVSEKAILENLPEEEREKAIGFLKTLNRSLQTAVIDNSSCSK